MRCWKLVQRLTSTLDILHDATGGWLPRYGAFAYLGGSRHQEFPTSEISANLHHLLNTRLIASLRGIYTSLSASKMQWNNDETSEKRLTCSTQADMDQTIHSPVQRSTPNCSNFHV